MKLIFHALIRLIKFSLYTKFQVSGSFGAKLFTEFNK
jgi:hypothetical protein